MPVRCHVESRVAELKSLTKELTVTAAAAQYGHSRQTRHRVAFVRTRTPRALDLDHPPDPAQRLPDRPRARKRPRSSYRRFEASQTNECWQSDFSHWRLADGTDVEVLNWLDDHSRYLIRCTTHPRVTGDIVVTEFLTACNDHGQPASTLTDNGRVYTARFGGGKNDL